MLICRYDADGLKKVTCFFVFLLALLSLDDFYVYLCLSSYKTTIMLPKFLLADNSQELPDTLFIIHTKEPRCIIECDVEDFNSSQTVYWLDEEPKEKELVEDVMDEAETFYNDELESQEDLYDEEFED